ncbi:transcription initiation protein SPT3 homolog isoform X4 [Parasteatoda tepidariorum]|uniref:transcription initiation protein SPT3 homolog isoform X4 n=1 Tax=Parasteatoda tepidariorum TaxID=114398 RepID=UPI001C723785|nr:transcription initiation protein SPT3 homolog isoform X4 [Parasteatoda tepidariorum]
MTSNKDLNIPPLFVEFVQNFVQEYLEVLEQKRDHVRERKKPPASFTREIRCIMHSFGDCKKPLWETVLYVEKILRQQMNLLLTKSSEVSHLRKGECISHEDLLFLLRNNKIKLKRLLRYLNIKDAKEVIKLPSRLTDLVRNPACGKRVKKCMKFLNSIDNLFMYEDILNEEIPDPKLEFRNKRKFDMVFSMSTEEYLEFKDTQQTTFFPKGGAEEFTAWLMEDGITDLTPSSFALEIINFFARETICEIIDLVMMLREDKISQTVHIPSAQESIEMKESDSNVEEKCSTNDSKDAITVLEIQEALQRYVKISDKNKFFYNDNLNVLIPDDLLCC